MMPSLDMMQQYAPNVAPQTIAAIIRVESGGNQYAIGINGPLKIRICPKSVKEAASEARHFISKGYSVDLGLMQINNRNLHGLGLTIEQAFDPRANIRAGATILARGYRGAIKRFGPGQDALRAALSAYNTGNYERGFKNGYVAKYYRGCGASGIGSLALNAPRTRRNFYGSADARVFAKQVSANPYSAELAVYGRAELAKPISTTDHSLAETAVANLAIADAHTNTMSGLDEWTSRREQHLK
jgi:type IV secretion system protein VirB1